MAPTPEQRPGEDQMGDGLTVELRPIAEEELARFAVVEGTGFGLIPSPGEIEVERSVLELDRTIAAFDDGEMVATTTAFGFDMTVPGGGTVPVAGVSGVAVAATHRRRGILRSIMDLQLDDVARRGEPMAILNASEAAIYGRFGYGAASFWQSWTVDTRTARFRDPVDDALALRIVPQREAGEVLPTIYDAWRAGRPGALTHSDAWWRCVLADRMTWRGGGRLFVVVCPPEPGPDGGPGGGHAGGYAIYRIDNRGRSGAWRLIVRDVVAADDRVTARLWRYLLEVDLVSEVEAEAAPLDDPLRWLLTDVRAVQTTAVHDYLFVRLLDVAGALEARRYPIAGRLVVEVHDPFRSAGAGCYELEVADDGTARCRRVVDPGSSPVDVTLDVAELGSLYLGGVSARELARAGRILGRTPGAVERATALFDWPLAPFCVTRF
jgi:predicted acetyltransferase